MKMRELALIALAMILLFASFGCFAQGSKPGEVEVHIGKQQPISADYLVNETSQASRVELVSSKYSDALSRIDSDLEKSGDIIRNEGLASNLSFSLYRSSQLD